ncbi:MAG TPA: glycosyltransferase family A protein [Actinoplanes sp.]|nr:glycosyltransferase family A protein [Actinoplanes sp.]
MTFRFSVVVPCYKEASYISDAIVSLQNQDFPGPYEIVVVDNNCTDDTARIARQLGVRVIAEPAPGVCNARQAGTAASAGEIVVSADADTTYAKDWLSRIDRSFRESADVVAVVGPCRYHDGPRWGRVFARTLFGAVHAIYRVTGRTWYVSATNIAFRRDRWTGYDTSLTQGGDELDLLRRMRRAGRVVYDHANPTSTSGRRFNRGFFYNVVVCLFIYYLSAYLLNRVTGRRLIGSAPVFRDSRPRPTHRFRLVAAALVAAVALVGFQQPRAFLAEKADTAAEYVHQHTVPAGVQW